MCGNLTLMGQLLAGEHAALPERARELLQAMLQVSQARGAQSGGAALLTTEHDEPRQRIVKCQKEKRGDLPAQLMELIERHADREPYARGFLVQTHMRFATSGPATREEAHPFRFVEVSSRGLRRVLQVDAVERAPTERAIETAITHNGDFDALRFRGVRIAFPELGAFLEHVLDAENRWLGDSPLLAGAVELFLAKGLWLEALRLAYLEVVAPEPPSFAELSPSLTGTARVAAARELLRASYPLPSRAFFDRLARVAEAEWLKTPAGEAGRVGDRRELCERLGTALAASARLLGLAELAELADPATCARFVEHALDAFLGDDLYRATRRLERSVEGTFGCVITSTLEPDTVLAFARGQPLSLGVQTSTGTVAIVSERNALRVPGVDGEPVFDVRLDLDPFGGEVVRVAIGRQPQLTLYAARNGRAYSREELEVSGRLVSLGEAAIAGALPEQPKRRLRADLLDVPEIARAIRESFVEPDSHNLATATCFARALFARPRAKLLVIGITNELWLAEQLVRNLKLCFPSIAAEARSSNDVLKEHATASLDDDTLVLAISQSGQDFPTLSALYQLQTRMGKDALERSFVLTGESDSLMGQAVGQSYSRRAPFVGRIFVNHAGYRPSEAATASVDATHLTLCELTLFLLDHALSDPEPGGSPEPAHKPALELEDLALLFDRREQCVDQHLPALVGAEDHADTGSIARQITAQGRRWGGHVLEGVLAFAGALLVLQANLQLGLGLLPSSLVRLVSARLGEQSAAADTLHVLGTQLDVLFYLFLTPLLVWGLRLAGRRRLLHRHGVRELLIGDTEYVSRLLWLLARRLFGLSYGFASIKPYAADNQDDLILTHEPLRGTLALMGLPDSRRKHLASHAGAAAMTAKQLASSRSVLASGAEVVTVGPVPTGPASAVHLGLPGEVLRPGSRVCELLVEGMFDSFERMLAMQALLVSMAERVSSIGPITFDPSRTKDQVFAPTTAAPVSGSGFLGTGRFAGESQRYSRVSVPFEVLARSLSGSRFSRPSGIFRRSTPPRSSRPSEVEPLSRASFAGQAADVWSGRVSSIPPAPRSRQALPPVVTHRSIAVSDEHEQGSPRSQCND